MTIWTFVSKVKSPLFNMLFRFVIAFLPRSKSLKYEGLLKEATPDSATPTCLSNNPERDGCAPPSIIGTLQISNIKIQQFSKLESRGYKSTRSSHSVFRRNPTIFTCDSIFPPITSTLWHCLTLKNKFPGIRIDAFKLQCWRRLLRVPWTTRGSNQSILKEINPEYSLEGLMLKLTLQTLVTWWEELTHWKRP